MRRSDVGLRLAVLLLVVVVAWHLLGAPRTAAEWQASPGQFTMAWNQLPVRMARVFRLWTMWGSQVTAQNPSQESSPEWKELMEDEKDLPIKVFLASTGQITSMPLEQYVAGVVAAEMPASYNLEALKAQAVAARTRAVRDDTSLGGTGCPSHSGADICTDSACCQGYLSPAERKEKWGASASAYEARIDEAVVKTRGQIMTYQGEPITVLYHAVSGGHTEDVQEVFSQALPYLKGVESSGEENTPKYQTTQTFDLADAAKRLNAAFSGAQVDAASLALEIAITGRTKTGRAAQVQVGQVTVTGQQFRAALALNSAMFTITSNEKTITFREKGYGHGVGMSQAGANAMAASGATWEQILTHYYTGIQIGPLPSG